MNRRKFIKKSLVGAAGIGVATGLYAWQVEPFWLEFVEIEMPLLDLPTSLVGKTLIQISDIHVGNRFDPQYLIESFAKAQAYRPDYVVYTGDYVNYENAQQIDQLREVMQHAVTGSKGTFAVLGNHDYGRLWRESDVAQSIVEVLTSAGIDVLRNESKVAHGLQFLGLDDLWGTHFAPLEVTKDYQKGQPSIALCHNPDVCDLDVWGDFKGWILAGHTHGGQCKPPFLPAPLLPVENKRYDQGAFDLYDGRWLYINRALGHLHQVRFNVRPEITVFELTQAVV